jgi:hypothetical protein
VGAAAIALVGVIVGAVITGSAPYLLGWLNELKAGRTAARITGAELTTAQTTIQTALDLGAWLDATPVRLEAWPKQRERLAVVLADPDWQRVVRAYNMANLFREDQMRAKSGAGRDFDPQTTTSVLSLVTDGIDTLNRVGARSATNEALRRLPIVRHVTGWSQALNLS